jgi:hypothetical protein
VGWGLADKEIARAALEQESNDLPEGCYCDEGKCMAPKPQWCRDAKKRDTLPTTPEEST